TCGAATTAPATSRAAGATSRRAVRRHRAEFLVDIFVAPSVPRATAGGSPAPYLLWMATKYERVPGEEQGQSVGHFPTSTRWSGPPSTFGQPVGVSAGCPRVHLRVTGKCHAA